ncbi:error-prone DNA polymerase [Gluconobacter japonicus]|uniref:Error-prone DNA polymerase n=1 Tax=Gluconobacter japonicus TaxID=376620 RepID=A0ABQ5WEC6_GLUJA|nr:error-prone DNA polymerase [Gluconobacter japonicus]KXV29418.1 DNA polymerase [Gluconobacter japonicus]GBR27922.1 DNA polymerase III subunit alpha [Gluconobacter japonicus NBRC 3271]GLQ58290.1 error-prone DNA polymerase 2 [Gluconobacter japonicus]
MTGYVELQVASNFSFLRGASHPDELIATARHMGYDALGITDFNTVAGIVRAHVAAREQGVRLIPGARLALTDGAAVLAYPVDRAAWGGLCRLLTLGHRRGNRQVFTLDWDDLEREGEGLIFILLPPDQETALLYQLEQLRALTARHGNSGYLALTRRARPGDLLRLVRLEHHARSAGIPTVVTGDVLYHAPERHILQDVVTSLRHGVTLEHLGAHRELYRDRHLKSPQTMAHQYAGFEDALARSRDIALRCHFSLSDLSYQYPEETETGETPQKTLARLVREALPGRYPGGPPRDVLDQLTHELSLIAQLEYAPYFLTVHTIVRQARSLGIVCQGRGSAANSAVCYVLGITAIDPVRSGLLFERFVSAERQEPPDIDVDFESDRREEIIQWIYRRYGRGHAALCATVMRYQPKGALRDVGKVMGLPEDLIGQISKHLASALTDTDVLDTRARDIGLDLREPKLALTLRLARRLLGFPRQLGTHPGGFVLTRDRLDDLVPIQPAAMEDRQIIVWDKDDIDALRFMKVDVLGLGMLGCLRRCFELLDQHHHRRLDMASIPPEDPATYAMIRKADTLGTFQIESRAQMSMLPRLRPDTFYDLVVQVAIVRPGPIQGNMVHPYLRRREGLEKPDCPSPALEKILGKTLGVPLFQEQAMQVAIHCAGFTPGEADQLRRSMATFKFTGGVSHFRDKLINGMVANGYDPSFAERTFEQLEGFGSYGFPESHAASFALVAYASSYLKCHHPDVFCAALLNAQPMGFYAPAQIVRDARAHGVDVRAIDINRSRWDCSLEGRPERGRFTVRLGFRLVKGLSNDHAARLIANRMPLYENIDDLWRRGDIPVQAIERLAEADAFRSLGLDRRSALWAIKGLADAPLPLFAAADRGLNQPRPEIIEPHVTLPPLTEGGEVVEDYRTAGLTLRRHPLDFLRPALASRGIMRCGDLEGVRDGRRVWLAGLVLMRQRPGTAKGVMFVTIEDESGVANLIVWKDMLERNRRILIGASCLGIRGTLQREGEVEHVIVREVEDLDPMLRTVGRDDNAHTHTCLKITARDFR